MECPNCHEQMKVVQVDIIYDGAYDKYVVCEHCRTMLHEKVRYNKVINPTALYDGNYNCIGMITINES